MSDHDVPKMYSLSRSPVHSNPPGAAVVLLPFASLLGSTASLIDMTSALAPFSKTSVYDSKRID